VFIDEFTGELDSFRLTIIKHAFDSLDVEHKGYVEIS